MTKPLTKRQAGGFVLFGILFWFVGAMSVRLIGDTFFTSGNPWLFFAFFLGLPAGYFFIKTATAFIPIAREKIFEAVAIMTTSAVLFDGIFLTFFRQLYHSDFEVSHYGAAWILWCGGVGLALGYYYSYAKRKAAAV
ncbi:hypothetical protein QRD89_18520 [Halobacillus sp. ACCC02827]|uniref:DUF5367 family protein n=1 Tax=Bacillaceae TaxID=186817 RepID=UPI0002A4D721|nr:MULTISPECIES: DUF5367 family protein [Bacillaceae]ELK44197.1 hypothetical protein D479_20088 [Halobacillus sp. BAB-2008]QHT48454.1 hypothetical protein M662_18840 [Bacillus sp. SB49]WJE15690.1 hypothetical protein QRD89_18520 [Halobacillus sp. ACCC02827]